MVYFACILVLVTITRNRAAFTYTDVCFVFETMSSEQQGHNLIHCFKREKREGDKCTEGIMEKKKGVEGQRYERKDTLLNFNALFLVSFLKTNEINCKNARQYKRRYRRIILF